MNRPRSSKCLLDIALVLNLVALPVLSLVLSQGWLDRLSSRGQVPSTLALLAVWTYGSITALALAYIRFRPPLVKVVMAVVSVLMSLAFIEVGGRLLRIPLGVMPFQELPSEKLHHVMPVQRYMYQGRYDDIDVFVETNEDRLRTPYTRDEFLKHRTRIAVLGDSFTFGFGVPGAAAYPARLEELLRVEYPELDVAVLNAGNISYSPIIQARQMEQVISAYEPQVVLLMIDLTDIGDDHKYHAALREGEAGDYFEVPEDREESFPGVIESLLLGPIRKGLGYPVDVIVNRLANRGLIGPREEEVNSYYRFEVVIRDVVETNRFFIYRHPLELTRPYFDSTLANIVAVANSAGRHGASFALFVPPRFHHWNPKEAPENWESEAYQLDEPYQLEYRRFFDEARERVDFPTIDLLPDFRASDEYPLVFREDPHWNSAGHDFVARRLLEHLKELRLIQP